jgi:hypothetical protein
VPVSVGAAVSLAACLVLLGVPPGPMSTRMAALWGAVVLSGALSGGLWSLARTRAHGRPFVELLASVSSISLGGLILGYLAERAGLQSGLPLGLWAAAGGVLGGVLGFLSSLIRARTDSSQRQSFATARPGFRILAALTVLLGIVSLLL